MKQVIYETKGRAREFSELACNIFTGCSHGCVYCYAPMAIHCKEETFHSPKIRVTAHDVFTSAKKLVAKGENRKVLFSFIGDPYIPEEQETQLTRKCITALHDAGLNIIILTKGGLRSTRDFDLLNSQDAYATTLTFSNDADSLLWEPKAATPKERVKALELASWEGIETWVSLEPIIDVEQTKALVSLTADITGHYKLGKLNYMHRLPPEFKKRVENINWYDFGWEMKELFDTIQAKYYFKNDLLNEMGISPTHFKQTWRQCSPPINYLPSRLGFFK